MPTIDDQPPRRLTPMWSCSLYACYPQRTAVPPRPIALSDDPCIGTLSTRWIPILAWRHNRRMWACEH